MNRPENDMPGRAARITRRVRQYPSWWLSEYRRGRDEGWERANRARAEYQETRSRYDAAVAAMPPRPARRQKGRAR